jgi:hypothetical protein
MTGAEFEAEGFNNNKGLKPLLFRFRYSDESEKMKRRFYGRGFGLKKNTDYGLPNP